MNALKFFLPFFVLMQLPFRLCKDLVRAPRPKLLILT